jgi:hypothetical protein
MGIYRDVTSASVCGDHSHLPSGDARFTVLRAVLGADIQMNWFARFKKTPSSFKMLVLLLSADCLLAFSFLVPSLYQRGFSHVGNLWWGTLVLFFFLFPDNNLGIRSVRGFALCIAIIYSVSTVSFYLLDRRAHADNPCNPSFWFYWFHWVDGIIFPWFVAAICYVLPRSSFPLRPLDKPVA